MEITKFKICFNLTSNLYGFTGKVAQGAFLNLLKTEGDMTTEVLHFSNRERPYAITPIQGKNPSYFEVTSLNSELSKYISNVLQQYSEKKIRLFDHSEDLFPPEISISYLHPHELQAGALIKMVFYTPTLFSSTSRRAKSDPYPHIHKIWANLIKLWNTYSNTKIEENLLEKIHSQIHPYYFRFKSAKINLGKIKTVGFTGKFQFRVKDPSGLDHISPLVKLADSFGVGAKRAMGFGRVRATISTGEKDGGKKNTT